ncbi:hypothetical protein [Mesorhizobium sp. ANAO-SY3R2]|uniref:hypothetical protein n=1 Tax=Mesorhizobium sp. ANAO-SY3R2 TaxID=3166644 RepID=UPI00366EE05D
MAKTIIALPLAVFTLAASANVGEKVFLASLSGNWHGSGQIRLKPDAMPLPVSCSLNSHAKGAAISLAGTCQAKIILSRRIGVDLHANGARYTGSYVGSIRGAARLDGTRSGNTLNLQIRWPDRGSGARVARMQVASTGPGHMRIVTIERLPKTGMPVVTAKIEFSRN